MSSYIVKNLEVLHGGDTSQLRAIFTDSTKIIVEAPAGYGKTKTLISKIAHDIATKKVKNHKKILVLTFSINAAHKIKKDVLDKLPFLLKEVNENSDKLVNSKIYVTNYHGLCRRILKKYGYLIDANLKNIDVLLPINTNLKHVKEEVLLAEEIDFIESFEQIVRELDYSNVKNFKDQYLQIVITRLLAKGYITHDAILLLTEELFTKYPSVLKFYQHLFSNVIIDEFQDTNLLSWNLVKLLTKDETKVMFLGDSLQRIYGFIGAIPNLFDEAAELYNTEYIHLQENYRFKDNQQMMLLDQNLRAVSRNPIRPRIIENSVIDLILYDTQEEEATGILKIIKSLNPEEKVAILVRQRGKNLDYITHALQSQNIKFFNGLFLRDDDPNYIRFHKSCVSIFIKMAEEKKSLTKKVLIEFYKEVVNKEGANSENQELIKLLKVFITEIHKENSWKKSIFDERRNLIINFFMTNSLKNYMENVDENLILTTVFGAKGLEWENVIIPDVEKDSYPNYFGLCKDCAFKRTCNITVTEHNEKQFIDELGVFYVAVTRAKKKTFFTASKKNANGYVTNISCFLKLEGMNINFIDNVTNQEVF
jgi:DNA helicase II / ATP-dependent DNA helicase PcrA